MKDVLEDSRRNKITINTGLAILERRLSIKSTQAHIIKDNTNKGKIRGQEKEVA